MAFIDTFKDKVKEKVKNFFKIKRRKDTLNRYDTRTKSQLSWQSFKENFNITYLKFQLRNYFGYNLREANGVLVLLLIILGFVAMPFVYDTDIFHKNIAFKDRKNDFLMLDSLSEIIDSELDNINNQENKKDSLLTNLFAFNPNTLTQEEWEGLGISQKLAKRVSNYTLKGGRFRKKEDLKKIYGFAENGIYEQLEPYIIIENTSKEYKKYPKKEYAKKDYKKFNKDSAYKPYVKKEFVIQPFDLNVADTTELNSLKGIGTKTSLRIIKYRESLGGFYDYAQLSEVFALSEEAIAEIKKYGKIDETTIRKISINKASIEEMKIHPYIKYNLAKVIVAYRTQHGLFKSEKDLAKIKILDEQTLKKIINYISYE